MTGLGLNLKQLLQCTKGSLALILLVGGFASFAIVQSINGYARSITLPQHHANHIHHARIARTVEPTTEKSEKKPEVQTKNNIVKAKLWFLKKDDVFRYMDRSNLPLFHSEDPNSDRILNQLMYIPPDYDEHIPIEEYKTIYAVNSFLGNLGPSFFKDCPVKTCTIVNDSMADVVITNYHKFIKAHPHQLVLLFIFESPARPSWEFDYVKYPDVTFDLTSTFSYDSDIISPYGKFFHYDEKVLGKDQNRNYAANKTKKAAWFASNCKDTRNRRTDVVKTLQKYIDVDMYGPCGNLTCKKDDKKCFDHLKNDYKFYLAFENSNCKDYITEKLFKNCLQNDILPVVMGAKREQYERVAPHNSFIHIDDFESVEHLGKYLNLVDQDDTLYNSYFRWKGTGELFSGIPYYGDNVQYWCRLCAVLNSPQIHQHHKFSLHEKRFIDWWDPKGRCWDNKLNIE